MTGLLLRLAVSAALVGAIGWQIGIGDVTARLLALQPAGTALAFAAVFAAIAVSVWKWGRILRARGHPVGALRLARHCFVGLAFNNVMPTTVGGDAVRAWETTRDTGEVPEAVGSVLTERLIAGAALGFTAFLGLAFVPFDARLTAHAAVFLAADLALVGLFLVPRWAEKAVGALVPARMASIQGVIAGTVAATRGALRDRRLFVTVALASMVFQLLVAAVNACIFLAMGVPVSLAHCIVFTPMIFTLTMLPVSISGLGVRELGYAYFFAQAGVAAADAVAASLLFFVIVGIASLPGALLFALTPRAHPPTPRGPAP